MRFICTPGRFAPAIVLLSLLIVSICFGADGEPPTYQFYAPQGYYNRANVYYLMTDVSNATYATLLNVNYTPLLANALVVTYMPSVYYVTNRVQGLVFSADWPATNSYGSYMPFWVLNTVTWRAGKTPVVLQSVSEIDSARRAGNVSVSKLRVVVAASIVVNSRGTAIPQASVSGPGPQKLVTLPVVGVFVDDVAYGMVQLDFSNRAEAMAFGGTYVPLLSKFNVPKVKLQPPSWQDLYCYWTIPPLDQLAVGVDAPSELGPGQANPNYTPLMSERGVRTTVPLATPFTNAADILSSGLVLWDTNYFSNRPIVRLPEPP